MACPSGAHKAFCFHILAMVTMTVSLCGDAHAQHAVMQDGREIIHVRNGPAGVVWAVQLSDLHFSSYYADRATSFQTLMGPMLALVNPSLVLITGDLTDAKSKDRRSRQQDEAEWIKYRQVMSRVIADSGLPSYAFYDLRGNHDKFGVPMVGGRLDYFSKYSISSLRNRTNTVQSITLMSSGWKHLFVGIDTSMDVGLRGPCNLFGHPSHKQLVKLDLELSQWDTCGALENVTKVVFGHFPLSFTASTEGGSRLEDIFAKHSISAYVCGHLHKSFGPNLIKHHVHPRRRVETLSSCKTEAQDGKEEFWEWEMGDWRMCRIMRIIVIDQGHTSYVDFDLNFLGHNASFHKTKSWLPTLVVPTYPLDSQKMERFTQPPSSRSIENTVRALIFSPRPLVSVVAQFYDTHSGKLLLLEEVEMHPTDKGSNMQYMYESAWNSTKYMDPSATRYVFQVTAADIEGTVTRSSFRPFSVERRVDELKKTWREFSVMGFLWEEVFSMLTWLAFTILFIFFILPKVYVHFILGNGGAQRWSMHLFRKGSQKLTVRRAAELCMWFFVQGCTSNKLWWGQLVVWVWLMFLPWYWGQALAEDYMIGFMSLGGWKVRMSEFVAPQSGLGWPDLMLIVLPYLYFVLLPLYTLIFALSAESFLHEIYQMDAPSSLKKKEQASHREGEMKRLLSSQGTAACEDRDQQNGVDYSLESKKPRPSGCRWIHMLLLGGCVSISFIHFGQVYAVAGAYGPMAVLASPGFAWPVPLLMIAAVLQSSACKKHQ